MYILPKQLLWSVAYEIDSDSMNWTDDQYIEYMEQDCAINLTVDKVYESEKVIVLKEVI